MMGACLLGFLFLLLGYPFYKHRWPEGFWPIEDDNETLDRIRRVGRRRVLPLPVGHERRERRGHHGGRQ